jgi:hypothetical protein
MRRPSLRLRREIDDASQRYGDPCSPANLLGENHPFARGEALRRDLRRQSGVTAVAVLVGAVTTASGYNLGLPLLISALLVQVGVAVALALHAGVQRERARELIIDGYGDLPLRGLRRERLRLQSAETRKVLADTLEALVSAAERWPVLAPAPPTFDSRQIRAVAPRLRALAAALRAREGSLCAVARVDRSWLPVSRPFTAALSTSSVPNSTGLSLSYEAREQVASDRVTFLGLQPL